MYELDKVANKAHNSKADGDSPANLNEFYKNVNNFQR